MHSRLRHARLAAGFRTATAAIARFGWRGSTYRAHENGENHFNALAAKRYAEAYGVSAGWLLTSEAVRRTDSAIIVGNTNRNSTVSASSILVGVALGVWRESSMDDYSQQIDARGQFSADPRYPVNAQFDVFVEDLSFSKHAKVGDYLRCVDVDLADIEVQDEDLVLIERVRDDASGQLKETTAKRVRRNGHRYEFWPDVEDTHWETPILVKDEVTGDGADITIKAKIIFAFRSLK